MTDNMKLNKMLELQSKLDKSLLEKGRSLGKIKDYDPNRVIYAFIDEIGELTHELKGNWCWWKATQKEVDNEKVLDELVDVWHFALSLLNYGKYQFDFTKEFLDHIFDEVSMILDNTLDIMHDLRKFKYKNDLRKDLTVYADNLAIDMLFLTYSLGFTIDDVYLGYKKKNAENFERIASGY